MFEGAPHRSFRLGHTLAVFGIFLSLLTLTFSTVNSHRTIAFGTGEIATLSNQYRSNAGLSELTTSDTLTISAQNKADHMAKNNYFAHDAPDGTSPWYFFDQSGYSYTTAGENLALTNQSASSVVDGWYNSPGHRANMLSGDFVEVGYGISFVPSFTYNNVTYSNVYLVAAHYAKPIAATLATTAQDQSPLSAQQAVQQVESATNTPTNTSPIPAAESTQTQKTNQEPVYPSHNEQAGTSTSGTMALASKEQPKLSLPVAYGGLALGITLVLTGVIIETRRLLRHQSLLPHHR